MVGLICVILLLSIDGLDVRLFVMLFCFVVCYVFVCWLLFCLFGMTFGWDGLLVDG